MSARVVLLDGNAARCAIGELATVLADCVDGGASVSFMAPFSPDAAAEYFRGVADEVGAGKTALLAAHIDGRILGTVQLGLAMPPNQPHRADVKKLLVHRAARRAGLGAALMTEAENLARAHGRSLLVLDTAAGSAAERLYERLGWQRAGVIPDYALMPDGTPCATVYFWKKV